MFISSGTSRLPRMSNFYHSDILELCVALFTKETCFRQYQRDYSNFERQKRAFYTYFGILVSRNVWKSSCSLSSAEKLLGSLCNAFGVEWIRLHGLLAVKYFNSWSIKHNMRKLDGTRSVFSFIQEMKWPNNMFFFLFIVITRWACKVQMEDLIWGSSMKSLSKEIRTISR